MNRAEALHLLGLEEGATQDDIKAAYKETVQILHPDRFASNKKLQERATEQFKNLQEAYEFLTSGNGARGGAGGGRAGAAGSAGGRRAYGRVAELEARLAGIGAARTQLQAQRDAFIDQRSRSLGILVVGVLVAFFARRIVWLSGIAGAAAFWGGFDLVRSIGSVNDLTRQLDELAREKRKILAELEELDS